MYLHLEYLFWLHKVLQKEVENILISLYNYRSYNKISFINLFLTK